MRKWIKERQKRENSQPISKRLRATLLRSFRGQHGKNGLFEGSARGNWDPTVISTQPKRGRGTHHHDEAAVNWCFPELLQSSFTISLELLGISIIKFTACWNPPARGNHHKVPFPNAQQRSHCRV